MKQILEEVHTWSVFNEEKQIEFNGYHVRAGDEVLLIDPVSFDAAAIDELGAPTTILVTNQHHMRRAAEARERWSARLLVPAQDRERIDAEVDGVFANDEAIGVLRVIGLSNQKTPGESALYWAERKLLFLGDALWGKPAGSLCMLPDAKYADPGEAKLGLRVLRELDVDAILMGDGSPILEGAGEVLRDFLS